MKSNLWIVLCTIIAAMTMTVSAQDNEPVLDVFERESGLTVTVQDLGDVVVHSLTAPEAVFANSTHIIETSNNLVLIDTQFLLPLAIDYRAYVDSLDKPIERLIITHEHPDHFLGSEAFNDVDIYALEEVAETIAEIGQTEVDEKQADFGDAIASTFVVPQVLNVDSIEVDGVIFQFETVFNAEAPIQLVTTIPAYGVASVGDIVYSGVHLIMAGAPPTWIEALENLKADSADYPIVLPGHGLPGTPELYDENIAWLSTAAELMETTNTSEEFKAGLVEAFPDLGMDAAIDFVFPFLFPDETMGTEVGRTLEIITVNLAPDTDLQDFLSANQVIREEYVSQQSGFLSRATAVSESGQLWIAVQWETQSASDASIAGFGEATGLEGFMSTLDAETMVITQYELMTNTELSTFPETGAIEFITVNLQEGADVDAFLAANAVIREEYVSQQPGFIARQTAVTRDGNWVIAVYWESRADAEASMAGFGEATGIEAFSSLVDFETLANTIYEILQ